MEAATGKVLLNRFDLGESSCRYITHRADGRAVKLDEYFVRGNDTNFAHAIVDRRCLGAQETKELKYADIASREDRRVDRRAREIDWERNAPRVIGANAFARGDERARKIFVD